MLFGKVKRELYLVSLYSIRISIQRILPVQDFEQFDRFVITLCEER